MIEDNPVRAAAQTLTELAGALDAIEAENKDHAK